jgi:hypothetical protein
LGSDKKFEGKTRAISLNQNRRMAQMAKTKKYWHEGLGSHLQGGFRWASCQQMLFFSFFVLFFRYCLVDF